jgi:hypothetical protein
MGTMEFHRQVIDSTFKGDRGAIFFNEENIAPFKAVDIAESTLYDMSHGGKVPIRHWIDVKIGQARINRERMNLFGYEITPEGGLTIADTNTVNSFKIVAEGVLLTSGIHKTATVTDVYFEGLPSPLGISDLSGTGNTVVYSP